ncbi:MAG: LacI family DNA-binding transcriptional regulator [Chitinophagaceae bacterium]
MLVNPDGQSTIVKSTIQDIARELRITASTVSRTLNGHAGISLATRLEVERIAKKLNYQINYIASSLRLGKSRIIGIIIPSAEISFFGSVVHGIGRIYSEQNYMTSRQHVWEREMQRCFSNWH